MLTVTYILFALFTGMIIGGFAFGNNTVGIIGVVLAVVDIIVGIVMTYFKNRSQSRFSFQQIQATAQKLQRLTSSPYSTETFTVAELASGVVNLLDAMEVLPEAEYLYLQKIYDKYQSDRSRMTVTFQGYLSYCDKIISNYDMVVPYYKVCGSTEYNLAEMLEDDKQPYRRKAKILIDSGKLFASEWRTLNMEFYKEFYDTDSE